MTHMAFSIFDDLQIHGFGVTFPVGCVPFGRLPGHLTLQSHKIDQSKLPKSSHLKLFKHLCIYIHTHIYIESCHVLVCGYVVIPVSFLWTFTCVYIELDILYSAEIYPKEKQSQRRVSNILLLPALSHISELCITS